MLPACSVVRSIEVIAQEVKSLKVRMGGVKRDVRSTILMATH